MTNIPWADKSWNPITGCSPISTGCENCYARRMANRLRGRFGYPKDDPFKPATHHGFDKLNQPLKWSKPRRIFVCSMGDLFHDKVQLYDQLDIWRVVEECYQHTFLMLTKRPERMKWFFDKMNKWGMLPNLWLGVTVEHPDCLHRINDLLQIPAAVRFVSVEPMLERIKIKESLRIKVPDLCFSETYLQRKAIYRELGIPKLIIKGIDWIIAGPETGPRARECKPEWIEDLYEQCKAAGVPFFDKRKDYLAREFPGGA